MRTTTCSKGVGREAEFWRRRNTPVRVHPEARIEHVAAERPVRSIQLPVERARRLLAECVPGRSVHEVIRAFGSAHPRITDRRIILGLQELLEGHFVCVSNAPGRPVG